MISANRARRSVASAPADSASSFLAATTRGSAFTRPRTSRANTVAAAGAPPITDAYEPSTATTSIWGFSALEKTTNAPPWYREITTNTMGPLKLVTARPISAPYSSCQCRIDSGDPSKPDRFARTTSGRLPLAAVTARAVFRDACGNSVPDVHDGGPSAGTNPRRAIGRDSRPSMQTLIPPARASQTTEFSPPCQRSQRSSGSLS